MAYVGDRIDNDVAPAADAGMYAVWLRRGPWAAIQHAHTRASRAAIALDSLNELPAHLRTISSG
ncbi:MAG: HAD hydrolase-like protein [Actinomycetota bacterium]